MDRWDFPLILEIEWSFKIKFTPNTKNGGMHALNARRINFHHAQRNFQFSVGIIRLHREQEIIINLKHGLYNFATMSLGL